MTTSHSSQGATVDTVLIPIDTEQSAALVNQQQFSVSLSRARVEARIFTDKEERLAQAVSRPWAKSTALDGRVVRTPATTVRVQTTDGTHPAHQPHERTANGTALRRPVATPRSAPVFVPPRQPFEG